MLPLFVLLIIILIYGDFVLNNMPIFKRIRSLYEFEVKNSLVHSTNSSNHTDSMSNQHEFSFIKLLVIHEQSLTTNKRLPPQPDCGFSMKKPYSKRMRRIVRGSEAEPNSYPWMASLKHFKNNLVQDHFCAGSLIYEKYILTAAHCLLGLDTTNFVAVLGLHYLNDSSDTALSNTYAISEIILHENYNQKDPNYDIALLKLSRKVATSKYVWPICLPDSNIESDSIVNKFAIVAGWGRSDPYNPFYEPDKRRKLQRTSLKIINGNKLCTKHLQSFDYSNLYCAHDTNLEKNSNVCIGDR